MIWKWCLGITLTVLPFVGGCQQGASKSAVTNAVDVASVTASNSVPDAADTADAAALAAAATNAPAVDISDAKVKPIAGEKPQVPAVRSSGPAGELLKLAGSGVEETVILSYITNSASVFNLSADEIIYLKDVGMSGAVITAALQRDLELKGSGGSETAQAVAPQENAGITTNWIGAAQQPTPAQVAPQPVSPAQAEAQPPAPAAQAVAAPAPQVAVTYSTFYSSLAPYGTWVDVEGYGPVWQPTVVAVNSGWQPYFDGGQWIYTDHGWYWASDYSWGWAPFHYGRWFHHHSIGWCWAPDYVWGPAWVTWRYNDAYCGWAPLPPAAYYRPGFGFTYYGASVGFGFSFGLGVECYSFVHWDHFHERHYHGHGVPPHEARDAYHNTKSVTRIVGNNNTIINEGISAQRVSAATRTEVRKVSLRESREPTAAGGRAERFDPARRTLTVYKPETPRNDGAGGIAMERVRTGARAEGSRTGTAAGVGSTPSRVTGSRSTGGVESRFGGTAASPAGQGTTPSARTTTGQGVQRRTGAAATQGSSQGTGQPQASPAPAVRENSSRPSSGTVGRRDTRSQVTVPRSGSAAQSTPSTGSAAPAQPQRSTQPQASPASPNRSFTTPGASTSQSAQPAQSPTLSSPRTYQTPSRVERQTTTQPATRSFSMPSSSAPSVKQYTPPSVSAPRQYSSPQAESRGTYTAPALAPSAPAQRQYSAPTAPQRSFSAPSAPPPSQSRSISSPNTSSRNSSSNGRGKER